MDNLRLHGRAADPDARPGELWNAFLFLRRLHAVFRVRVEQEWGEMPSWNLGWLE